MVVRGLSLALRMVVQLWEKSLIGCTYGYCFAYHPALSLRSERRSLLFSIAVANHCVFTLVLLFSSAMVGEFVDYIHVFESATTLSESGVLLPLLLGVHISAADAGYFSILEGL